MNRLHQSVPKPRRLTLSSNFIPHFFLGPGDFSGPFFLVVRFLKRIMRAGQHPAVDPLTNERTMRMEEPIIAQRGPYVIDE